MRKAFLYIINIFTCTILTLVFYYFCESIISGAERTAEFSFLIAMLAALLSMWYRQKDLLKEEYQEPIKKAMKKGKTIYAVIISTDDKDKEKKKAQWIQLPK